MTTTDKQFYRVKVRINGIEGPKDVDYICPGRDEDAARSAALYAAMANHAVATEWAVVSCEPLSPEENRLRNAQTSLFGE